MYSSLNTENNTVIKLKDLAKQRGIKGYLRKAELIQKLEDVNVQVLIPVLEILRNTTGSVNTSAILDDLILGDNTPVLQPTPKFIPKSRQKIKNCGNWLLDYIPSKPKVVDEALEWLKNLIKKLYNKSENFIRMKSVKICVEKVCNAVSNRWKRWISSRFISG